MWSNVSSLGKIIWSTQIIEVSLNSKPMLAQFAELVQFAELTQLVQLAQFGKFF